MRGAIAGFDVDIAWVTLGSGPFTLRGTDGIEEGAVVAVTGSAVGAGVPSSWFGRAKKKATPDAIAIATIAHGHRLLLLASGTSVVERVVAPIDAASIEDPVRASTSTSAASFKIGSSAAS